MLSCVCWFQDSHQRKKMTSSLYLQNRKFPLQRESYPVVASCVRKRNHFIWCGLALIVTAHYTTPVSRAIQSRCSLGGICSHGNWLCSMYCTVLLSNTNTFFTRMPLHFVNIVLYRCLNTEECMSWHEEHTK